MVTQYIGIIGQTNMGYLSDFNGVPNKYKKFLYGTVGLLQVITLFIQLLRINTPLQDHCPLDTTTAERENANWAGWTNFLSLVLCSLFFYIRFKELDGYLKFLVKIGWIGVTAVAFLLVCITYGHAFKIRVACPNLLDDDVENSARANVILWFLLLALAHSGESDRMYHKKDDDKNKPKDDEVPVYSGLGAVNSSAVDTEKSVSLETGSGSEFTTIKF